MGLNVRSGRFPGLRTQPFGVLDLDLFAAVEEAFDRTGSDGLFIKNVKHRFDRTQNDMQRDAAFLPHFDQSPIQRAQEQILGPAADKCVFDLGEIVKVIHGSADGGGVWVK